MVHKMTSTRKLFTSLCKTKTKSHQYCARITHVNLGIAVGENRFMVGFLGERDGSS